MNGKRGAAGARREPISSRLARRLLLSSLPASLALVMNLAQAMLQPSPLRARRRGNSGYSRYRDLNIGLPRRRWLSIPRGRDRAGKQQRGECDKAGADGGSCAVSTTDNGWSQPFLPLPIGVRLRLGTCQRVEHAQHRQRQKIFERVGHAPETATRALSNHSNSPGRNRDPVYPCVFSHRRLRALWKHVTQEPTHTASREHQQARREPDGNRSNRRSPSWQIAHDIIARYGLPQPPLGPRQSAQGCSSLVPRQW